MRLRRGALQRAPESAAGRFSVRRGRRRWIGPRPSVALAWPADYNHLTASEPHAGECTIAPGGLRLPTSHFRALLTAAALGFVTGVCVALWALGVTTLLERQAALEAAAAAPTPTLFTFPTATPTLEGPTVNPTWTITPTFTPTPTRYLTSTPRPTDTPYPTSTPLPTHTPFLPPTERAPAPPNPAPAPIRSPYPASTAIPPPDSLPPLELIATLPPVADLPEVALEVELFYADHWARVEQVAVIPNTSPDFWRDVAFNVPLNGAPGAFALDEVRAAAGDSALSPAPYSLSDVTLRVSLPRPAAPRQSVRVELHYRLFFPWVSAGTSFPVGVTGWTGDVIHAGEWYPVIAPYQPGSGWQTYPYHPVGDPVIYPAANYSMAIQTQEGIAVAGSGPVGQSTGLWRFRAERARGMAFFASSQYQVARGEVTGSDGRRIPIISYYLTGFDQAGQDVVQVAGQALTTYAELFGPYPYFSLTVVQNGTHADMEYTALVSLSNRAYSTYRGRAASSLVVLTAHEVAHQWWYGLVGNDQVYSPWLDESLAAYSEVLFYEKTTPDLAAWRLGVFEGRYRAGPLDVSIYAYDTTAEYVAALYPRGVMFQRDLRALVGDEAYFAFLRDYAQSQAGRLATPADFFAALRRHTSLDVGSVVGTYFDHPVW